MSATPISGRRWLARSFGECHGLKLSKETARKLMTRAGLWIPRRQRPPRVYQPRARRACLGELNVADGKLKPWLACSRTTRVDGAAGASVGWSIAGVAPNVSCRAGARSPSSGLPTPRLFLEYRAMRLEASFCPLQVPFSGPYDQISPDRSTYRPVRIPGATSAHALPEYLFRGVTIFHDPLHGDGYTERR